MSVFTALDAELRERSDGTVSLDDVVRALWQRDDPVELATLIELSEELTTHKPDTLHISKLPGCRTIHSETNTT